MVDDMYQKTGAFNWTAYMESLPEKICGTEYGQPQVRGQAIAYCIAYIKILGILCWFFLDFLLLVLCTVLLFLRYQLQDVERRKMGPVRVSWLLSAISF